MMLVRRCASSLSVLVIMGASVVISLSASVATAQESDSTTNNQGELAGIEQITVTARRREELVQDVPIVVNVISAEQMDAQDMRTFTDIERMLPGVSTCCSRGGVSAFTFIRGVNSTAAYFAEVPTTLNGSSLFFDLASVQVLKGPQGTLFGISTNGGAVLYAPRKPSDEFEGYVTAGFGDYGRMKLEGVVNIPLTDNFSLRVGGARERRDGYVLDVTHNREMGNENYWTGRVSASWQVTDALENYTLLNYHESDTVPITLGIPYGPNAGIDPDGLFQLLLGGPELDTWIEQQEALGPYEIVGTSVPGGPRSKTQRTFFVNTTTLDITPSVTLKSILGYSESDSTGSANDLDSSPFPGFETSFPTNYSAPSKQYSAEFHMQGDAFDNRLTYVIGSFNRWTRQPDRKVGYSISLGNRSGTRAATEGRSNSLFAEGTFDLDSILEGLDFTVGYRYTRDKRTAFQERYNGAGVMVSNYNAEGDWQEGSYRWGFSYSFASDVMLYFTNSKGYSSGGFNLTAPPELQIYEPESVDNYEIGIKSEWMLAGLLGRTNLSAYYGDWDDMQTQVTSRCATATGTVACQLTRNAATGKISGFEAEFALEISDSIRVSSAFGYMDGQYTDFVGLDPFTGECCIDLSDSPFLYIPEWKYSVRASYYPTADGTVKLGAAYSWTDNIRTIFRTSGVDSFFNTQPPMKNLNLTVDWSDVLGHQGLDATFLVSNVLENEVMHGQFGVYESVGIYGRQIALPRMWALTFTYEY